MWEGSKTKSKLKSEYVKARKVNENHESKRMWCWKAQIDNQECVSKIKRRNKTKCTKY